MESQGKQSSLFICCIILLPAFSLLNKGFKQRKHGVIRSQHGFRMPLQSDSKGIIPYLYSFHYAIVRVCGYLERAWNML